MFMAPVAAVNPADRFADKDSGMIRFLGSPETHLKTIACSAGHYFGDFHLKGTMAGRDGETNYRYQMQCGKVFLLLSGCHEQVSGVFRVYEKVVWTLSGGAFQAPESSRIFRA